MPVYQHELDVAIRAVRAAGDAVMAVYSSAAVYQKADGTEVTDADYASDRIIREIIGAAFPDDAILTEEGIDDPSRLSKSRCWLVDPIDGTAAFVRRTGDFDVYIALAVDGRPVVAATIQPATGLMLTAVEGAGAQITEQASPSRSLRYEPVRSAPRIATRPWLGAPGNLPILRAAAASMGDGAIAFAAEDGLGVRSFVPERAVDVVAGFSANGSTIDGWEWDIAAVDLIVREAGGCSSGLDGERFRFNQPYPRFPTGLVWSVDPFTHDRVLSALAAARVN